VTKIKNKKEKSSTTTAELKLDNLKNGKKTLNQIRLENGLKPLEDKWCDQLLTKE